MGDLIGAFAGLLDGIGGNPFGQIILSVIAGLILLEVIGLIECGAVRLLRLGAKVLPPAFRDRYIEENEAVIRSVSGPFAKAVCMASAMIGAIRLRISFEKEEIDSLERKSQGEKRSASSSGTEIWIRHHPNLEQILSEIIEDDSRRNAVFHSLMSPLNDDSIEIPLDEKEFYEIVKKWHDRYQRED
jgi:hypothetical protein